MPNHPAEPPPVSLLILAAGASSRMRGADKLMEPVQGQPLLRRVALNALGTGLPVVMTLAPNRPARLAALDGLAVRRVLVTNTGDGMGASVRAGVATIPPDHAIMVLLADMPELDMADLAAVLAAYRVAPTAIHRACAADGTPGHPVVFPPWARADLLAIAGDAGAKPVLQAHIGEIALVPLPASHAVTDLDTPENWATWRKAQP
jgi:molybdenum cofactor cytidylyltransferase